MSSRSGIHISPCQSRASLVLAQRREVVLEQPVDEDVAAADFAQEDAFSGVVKEADQVPGQVTFAVEYVAQSKMENNSLTTIKESTN